MSTTPFGDTMIGAARKILDTFGVPTRFRWKGGEVDMIDGQQKWSVTGEATLRASPVYGTTLSVGMDSRVSAASDTAFASQANVRTHGLRRVSRIAVEATQKGEALPFQPDEDDVQVEVDGEWKTIVGPNSPLTPDTRTAAWLLTLEGS